jgi:hypothetical protein
MTGKSTILTLDEFLKLKGRQKKPVVVYFNEQQWRKLTRGLKPTDEKMPKTGVRLALTALPGMSGGFVEMHCPTVTKITGAEGQVRCSDPPAIDTPNPSQPHFGCSMRIRRDGQVVCEGKCDQFGNCRKKSYGTSFGPRGSFSAVLVLCVC